MMVCLFHNSSCGHKFGVQEKLKENLVNRDAEVPILGKRVPFKYTGILDN